MLKALHAPTGVSYEAGEFGGLPGSQRSVLKPDMVCLRCQTQAHYRRAANNGRAAAFYCRPHPSACELSTVKDIEVDEAARTVVADRIANSGDIIEVDFSLPRTTTIHATNAPGTTASGTKDRIAKRHVGKERRAEAQRQRWTAILGYLIADPGFAISDRKFRVRDMITMAANEFFVEFSATTPDHQELYRAYWGVIDHAHQWNDHWYLNSGPIGNVGIHLDPDQAKSLMERIPGRDFYRLAGHIALAVGRYYRGTRSPTIELDDPLHIVTATP